MKLDYKSLVGKALWDKAGIRTPRYDCLRVRDKTGKAPVWIHFGAGNIFRGFISLLQHKLLNEGTAELGVIAAESYDFDIIEDIYKPHDNLSLFVGLHPDGKTDREVSAAVTEALRTDRDRERLNEIFRDKGLQLASFTITEKGYATRDANGGLLSYIEKDMTSQPQEAKSAMGVTAALLLARYKAGGYPLALVSMDNCSKNGELLGESVLAVASAWRGHGFADDGFIEYLSDPGCVSFPWTMIDKITPRPDPVIVKQLAELGLEDMEPVVTSAKTYIAPFVNAEIPQYLVVENDFPNGRPPLERAGVYFTDRETVNACERMKVSTCLNPLHTALAVFGCLLGFERISEEMRDRDLKKLVEGIGYQEGLPVSANPGILDPERFIDEVINVRFPNPFVPDTPQRIATDTSQKVRIRFGETIKRYIERTDLDVRSLKFIPLALAGWLRYLLAVDDNMETFEPSSDPMLETLQNALRGVTAGKPESYGGQLRPVLSNAEIFGTDLCACGLNQTIERMFVEMLAGKGAVREVLRKYVS